MRPDPINFDKFVQNALTHFYRAQTHTHTNTQVGLAEMKGMVLSTGGVALQTDTFHSKIFWDTLKRLFQKETDEGFIGCSSNGVLEVCVCACARSCVCVRVPFDGSSLHQRLCLTSHSISSDKTLVLGEGDLRGFSV
jgi:hypothetical protein